MPVTLSLNTGDGITTPRVRAALTLPDSGHGVSLSGTVQTPGKAEVALSGGPLTAPSVPSAGVLYWQIQVDTVTGVATVVSSGTTLAAVGGMSFPLLLGQLEQPTLSVVATGADPELIESGPKGVPLLVGSLMPTATNVPRGRTATPADQSDKLVIFRQGLESGSPAAMWQNPSNEVIGSY